MAGGNHHSSRPSSHSHHHKPSSSSHRKSRWESDRKPSSSKDLPKPAPPQPQQHLPPKPSPQQNNNNNNNNNNIKNNNNPNNPPTPTNSNPIPSPAHPKFPHDPSGSTRLPHPPFPDLPTYGFHMLDRRTIVLADGTVRSYFALPPDYQDFTPPIDRFFPRPELGGPMSPGGIRPDPYGRNRNPEQWNGGGGEGSLKRKFGEEQRDGKDELLRKKQQLLQYGNANSISNVYSLGANDNSSNAFSREEELRPSSKYLRMGGAGGYDASLTRQSGGGNDNVGLKHCSVDQDKLKKAFLRFVKLVNENTSKRKTYLGDGREGSLQCVVCGRFDNHTGVVLLFSSILFVSLNLLALICLFCLSFSYFHFFL